MTNIKKNKDYTVKEMISLLKEFSIEQRDFAENFINKLNLKYSSIKYDKIGKISKIGTINPNNLIELEKENLKLYNYINENFNNNFFDCLYLNSPLDNNIKFNIIAKTIEHFPFIKKLCNIYSKNGYTFKIIDFYSEISEINIKNIDSLLKKEANHSIFSEDNTLGQIVNFNSYTYGEGTCLATSNYYFCNKLINSNKRLNLNNELIVKLNENKLKKGINKEYYYDIFKNLENTIHEFNHFIIYMLKKLTYKNCYNKKIDNSFLIIFENIYKIIYYFLKDKKINSFLEIIKFINDENNNDKIKEVLTKYDDIHRKKQDEMLKNIRMMLSFGDEEQQCKLLEVLSYMDEFNLINYEKYKDTVRLVKNNLTSYSLTDLHELIAELNVNAILSDVKEDKEYAEILIAFTYCWINHVLENTNIKNFNKSARLEVKNNDYYENIIKCIKNNFNNSSYEIEYKQTSFDYNYDYFTIAFTDEELENIKRNENISELALKYSRRIKFSDYLENCYVNVMINKKKDLKTFIFKNDHIGMYRKSYYIVDIKPIIITNSIIENNIKKIEILMHDFYKFLYKEDDEDLSKFNILGKMQLICFFYKLLNEEIGEENYVTIKNNNSLFNIAINGIIKDIIKTNLNNNSENILVKILDDENLKKLYDPYNIDKIDESDIKLYINKEYLNNIKIDEIEKNNNIDPGFLIQKIFNNDYFYLVNSTLKNTGFEKYSEQYLKTNLDNEEKEITEEIVFFKLKKFNFDFIFEIFIDEDKNIIEFNEENFQNCVKIRFLTIFEGFCRNDEKSKQEQKSEKESSSSLESFKLNDDYKEIIKKNLPKTYNTTQIENLLIKIINTKKLIVNIEKKYNKFINVYENYNKTAICEQNIIKKLKYKVLGMKENLSTEIDESKKKIDEFYTFFNEQKDNIKIFIKDNIDKIYDNIGNDDKKNDFIKYFNKYFNTDYPLNKDSNEDLDED